MRILVTGGAGFIGSHLDDALIARGHNITVVDNLVLGRKENIEHLISRRRGGRVPVSRIIGVSNNQ